MYFTLTNGQARIKVKQFFLFGKVAFFSDERLNGCRVTPSLHISTNYHLWSLLQLHNNDNNTICKMYTKKFSRQAFISKLHRKIQFPGTTLFIVLWIWIFFQSHEVIMVAKTDNLLLIFEVRCGRQSLRRTSFEPALSCPRPLHPPTAAHLRSLRCH